MNEQEPLDPRIELGLTPEQLPRHVAIIMDGNGRWANQKGLPRVEGHSQGAESVRRTVTYCARLAIETLTLYSFSTENWKRPKEEVDYLMRLCAESFVSERGTLMKNNVRFLHVGDREGLPDDVLREMDITLEMTSKNTGLTMCVALNYGSRAEILRATKSIADQVAEGTISLDDIDEERFSGELFTAGVSDPDLMIRTANERRISNFLLWQISYSEVSFCNTLWPDFGEADLAAAFKDYAGRQRRYGGIIQPQS